MKRLLKAIRLYYERELSTMQSFNAEFAAEFPAQAGQLGMEGGQRNDPHIERFIQATALSNARIAKLIDDNDYKVTEALLQLNYPHYLQPFPSTAIVRVDPSAGLATMTAPGLIPRGATLVARSADGPSCRLRTVFDVHITPPGCGKGGLSVVLQLAASDAATGRCHHNAFHRHRIKSGHPEPGAGAVGQTTPVHRRRTVSVRDHTRPALHACQGSVPGDRR